MNRCETIGDVMAREVLTVRLDQDLHELEKLLVGHRIHGVPVVDGAQRIVGVVSQTDLLAWHFETGVDGVPFYDQPVAVPGLGLPLRVDDTRTASVAEIMSPMIHAIGPEHPIAEAASRMLAERIHRLIVVDEGFRVVGQVSAFDLLRGLPGVSAPPQRTPVRRA
jgi:CBS-domain-containing membrane protein